MNDLKFTTAGEYMRGEIFLTSDTHYHHSNILKFMDSQGVPVRGGFETVEEMNEAMFDGWNETIRENDTVYHLGDLAMGPYKSSDFAERFRSLPGKKYLIVGNHDDIKWCVKSKIFKEVMMWRKFKDQKILLSHVPLDVSSLKTYDDGSKMLNYHGHIHQMKSPTPQHRCVCVEWTNYKPIHIDEVSQLNNFV